MRIIFLGSPESVIAPLNKLWKLQGEHELIAVISQPARRVGRGKKYADPYIADFAKKQGIRTLQPENAGDPGFLNQLRALQPDLMITAAYGQILTDEFLSIPTRGTINIHPSLLPKFRGATPVPAALLNEDTQTGVTILFTVKKLDAGNLIVQESTDISIGETADVLTNRLFELGASLLPSALEKLSEPTFVGDIQRNELVSHCKKISKDQGAINWEHSNSLIASQFRALYPWPGIYTYHGDRRISLEKIVLETANVEDSDELGSSLKIGEATFNKKKKFLIVKTGSGVLKIEKLKPANGKVLDAASFWNGINKIDKKISFTSCEHHEQ